MPRSWMILLLAVCSTAAVAEAATVEHTFNVATLSWPRICQPGNMSITAVDGVPGPVIQANEGDTVVVHVINDSPNDITIHWHGIFQRGTPWADGPSMVTQCPIRPGHRYTYRFNITGQEGTLWWHAHASMLRATIYGALIIKPRTGNAYPFPAPAGEKTVLLGEWYNDADTIGPNSVADAYTINGSPGDSYSCETTTTTTTKKRIEKFEVRGNSTYLLRIINAALNTAFFFKVAGHTFTVVAADASYTTPYETDVIVVAPGQTVDALMAANASPGRYYMAISSYQSASPLRPASYNGNVTTAVLEYIGAAPASGGGQQQAPPPALLPEMPGLTDTATANRFYTSLTALVRPGRRTVPLAVDTSMFVTVGLGLVASCKPAETTSCSSSDAGGTVTVVATMNNHSFVLPKAMSMLDAMYRNTPGGVYTRDFPDQPPVAFDYTNQTNRLLLGGAALLFAGEPATKVRTLKYNATVEMVLQNTALVGFESHPMHLHGFSFFVIAQGFGNYVAGAGGAAQFNLVNPQERNTIAVPTGGWAVIRFVADNPGMWFMHCHMDSHLSVGLGMVLEVEDGPNTKLPAPPQDLPKC